MYRLKDNNAKPWVALWLEIGLQIGRPGFDSRCYQIPSEYKRSTFSLNQWFRSLVGCIKSTGTGEFSFPFRFHSVIVEVEIVGVAIYRPFGEFHLAKSYCHLHGAQGQRQAYILLHAAMNIMGLDLTTSDRWH
ncbi:hypothetical protein TNCV_3133071 [Trichonephila clavipes]|nr:hypothetical protein TNCV_3133071 [Trichonephila clavipes]